MRFSKVALSLMAITALSGCSGSDDDTQITPPPEPIPPQILSFAIEGIATDAPVANATITATLGEQTITTTADDDGLYSLEFEYEEGTLNGDEMVLLSAQGEGDQAHIELVSQLGSFESLNEQAGDDGVLAQDESSRTAITQVSTALHLLAEDTGVELDSDEALAEAEAQVETEALLELSAVIKVLADNPDYTPETGTILELLTPEADESVEEAVNGYLADNGLLDEEGELTDAFEAAFEEALEETVNDPAVTLAFTAEELLGTNIYTTSVTQGWVAQNGNLLNFAADGTASLSNPNVYGYFLGADVSAEWAVNEANRLVVNYGDNQQESYPYLTLADVTERWGQTAADTLAPMWEEGYLRVVQSTDAVKFTKLTDGAESKVAVEISQTFTLDPTSAGLAWEGELPSYQEIELESAGVLHLGNQVSTLWDSAPQGTWALPMVTSIQGFYDAQPYDYLVHNEVTLAEGGSVLDKAGEARGQWSYADGVLTIASGDWTVSYQPYVQSDALYSAIVSISKGEFEQSNVAWIAQYDQGNASLADDLVQEMPYVLGAWINSWMASEGDPTRPDFDTVYGYTFGEDGSLSWTYGTYTDPTSGEYVEDQGYFETYYNAFQHWEQVGDHEYLLTGETVFEGWSTYSRERSWTVINTLADGRHLVLERSVRTMDYVDEGQQDQTGPFIFPRINVLSPVDLSQFEEEYQRSEEYGTLTGVISDNVDAVRIQMLDNAPRQ
ncbi:hypothetical protein [Ferrimonas balearica]|uniref:hypothetical protein n=1 Tax=Ferrimonas balearica TaxID=44012 RepID=UPI001F3F0481|nr:hypothetical protein [Ferrimonas balearica]MBY6096323.1 hypothetical protein [Ferrimonas balearica]